MRGILLRSTAMIGIGSVLGSIGMLDGKTAAASDGIKLDVGGYFSTAYVGVLDNKGIDPDSDTAHFGHNRNADALKHDAEVRFEGSLELDNGLTIEARLELIGEEDGDQIDKSWISFSGGFGLLRIGAQNDAIETQCPTPPGGTANFSAFSPVGWGSNDPIGSNSYCFSADNDSQKVLYVTPEFSGFQLSTSYTPSANAENYGQVGVNGAGTPTNPDGTAHHIVTTYLTYNYEGEDWGLTWGGGGSWQLGFNKAPNFSDGKSSAYQTSGAVTLGSFAFGGSFVYFDVGGQENDMWTAGAGLAYYATDQITLGLQYSHGRYDGDFLGDGISDDGAHHLNRVVATANYNLAPGVDLDADVGYTWYRDSRENVPDENDTYDAVEIGIGSAFSF